VIAVAGAGQSLVNLSTGQAVAPDPAPAAGDMAQRRQISRPETHFTVTIEPHSYQVFKIAPPSRRGDRA